MDQDTGNPFLFPGTIVLTGKADGSLVESVHGGIDEAFNIAGRSVASHGNGAEGIDRGLNQHIGNGENRPLHARRKSDADHQDQAVFMDFQFIQVQAVHAFLMNQTAQNQKGGNALGDHGCDGNARHAQMENNDENQVEDDVDHTGGKQEVQRPLGISDSPKDGCAKVIEHGGRHADEIDAHVQSRLIQYVFRGSHKRKKGTCQKNADKNEDDSADQTQQDRGMHRLADCLFLLRSDVIGTEHIGAHRKADEDVHQQIDERAGASHRSKGLMPGKTAGDDDVCSIEQKLQDAGEHERNGKAKQLAG